MIIIINLEDNCANSSPQISEEEFINIINENLQLKQEFEKLFEVNKILKAQIKLLEKRMMLNLHCGRL